MWNSLQPDAGGYICVKPPEPSKKPITNFVSQIAELEVEVVVSIRQNAEMATGLRISIYRWIETTKRSVFSNWSFVNLSFFYNMQLVPFQCLMSSVWSRICDNYTIIAYYFQRPAMNEKFAQRVTKFNENSIPEEVYKMNRHLEYTIVPVFFSFSECAMV